jgi:hypothetical protein
MHSIISQGLCIILGALVCSNIWLVFIIGIWPSATGATTLVRHAQHYCSRAVRCEIIHFHARLSEDLLRLGCLCSSIKTQPRKLGWLFRSVAVSRKVIICVLCLNADLTSDEDATGCTIRQQRQRCSGNDESLETGNMDKYKSTSTSYTSFESCSPNDPPIRILKTVSLSFDCLYLIH